MTISSNPEGYEQGDVVYMQFPFTDLSATKLRPAVVVSNEMFNVKKNLIFVALSSKENDPSFSMPIQQIDLVEGELNKQSFVRFQNIFTLERSLVSQKVARLTPDALNRVLSRITSFLHAS